MMLFWQVLLKDWIQWAIKYNQQPRTNIPATYCKTVYSLRKFLVCIKIWKHTLPFDS